MEGPEPAIVTHGNVLPAHVNYAVEKITGVYRLAPRPLLFTSIRLVHEANRKNDRPCIAEATLDASGQQVRGHVAAATMPEAIDLLEERVSRQIRNLHERAIALERRPPVGKRQQPNEWRRSNMPNQRPNFFDREAADRELLRRKSFAMHGMTPDEAAFDMEMLDHDFYLFTNINTDEENVIVRQGKEPYELLQLRAKDKSLDASAVKVQASDITPPETDIDTATTLLDESSGPFLFFLNKDTGRGNLIYRRYDGHYGLITPGKE